MARKVTTAPQAAKAFRQARRWLTQTGAGPDGQARWETLRTARFRLLVHPYLGASMAGQPKRRQLVVGEYRIIYVLQPDTGDSATAGDIAIVAVLGPGQRQQGF